MGNIILSCYGYQQNNYINPESYKFNFSCTIKNSKLCMMKYYIKNNRWFIIDHIDENDNVNDNTLKYALKTVGCIHCIEFDDNGPIFNIHLNKKFRDKYESYYDNCRKMEYNILTVIWWCINITDLFNYLFIKYKNELKNKYYINILDHPIKRKNDNEHPFYIFRKKLIKHDIVMNIQPDVKYPIYCWCPNKKYLDIGLPFHDIWMFLYCREFNLDFNILNYKLISKNDYDNKLNNKVLFRGSYTNCNKDIKKSPRIIAHIKSVQNDFKILDAIVTPSLFSYTDLNNSYISSNIEYFEDKNKLLTIQNQLNYKYILNIDGFASAFRIIKELYYNTCIIIPNSNYTDVIRNYLVPFKHYIPCKKKLENIINTYKWCEDNHESVKLVINNMIELREKFISIKNILGFTFEILNNNNNNCNHNKIIEFISNQKIIDNIPIIEDDIINIKNKNAYIYKKDISTNKINEKIEVKYGGKYNL